MAAEKDPLDFLETEELLRFFHYKKTEMSCMEKPQIFLRQLRDHDLISEDRYKMVSCQKNKEIIKKAIHDILDQIEKEQSQRIHVFWRCVFKKIIMDQYPTLQLLHKDLTDGSQLPETVEKERKKRKELSDIEAEEENSGKKKKKQRSRRNCDEEKPGSSFQLSPAYFLNKGEKKNIWTSSQLPVTCGDLEGTLYKDRLDKGEKCILFQQWFTPHEFKKFSKKVSFKSWKRSIRCKGTPLGELIQEGHLKPVKYKRGCEKAKKFLFPSDQANTVPIKEEDGGGSEDQEDDTDQEEKAQEFVREASLERIIAMKTEKEQTEEHKHTELSKDEDKEEKQRSHNDEEQLGPSSVLFSELVQRVEKEDTVKKNMEKRRRTVSIDDEEQPGPSSQTPVHQKKSRKTTFSSPSKKGETAGVRRNTNKFQLPVTCGELTGTLNKDKLAKGKSCILFNKRWFTPPEFELRAGRGSSKNWKLSIRCNGKTLKECMEEWKRIPPAFRGGAKKTTRRKVRAVKS